MSKNSTNDETKPAPASAAAANPSAEQPGRPCPSTSSFGPWRAILPYRTNDNLIEGLVLTFVEVTMLKTLRATRRGESVGSPALQSSFRPAKGCRTEVEALRGVALVVRSQDLRPEMLFTQILRPST